MDFKVELIYKIKYFIIEYNFYQCRVLFLNIGIFEIAFYKIYEN